MPEDSQGMAWHDFPSFVAHVRAACARLQVPEPSLAVLELEYPRRCAELARINALPLLDEAAELARTQAVAEVEEFRSKATV